LTRLRDELGAARAELDRQRAVHPVRRVALRDADTQPLARAGQGRPSPARPAGALHDPAGGHIPASRDPSRPGGPAAKKAPAVPTAPETHAALTPQAWIVRGVVAALLLLTLVLFAVAVGAI
jgi:hypothetical protein